MKPPSCGVTFVPRHLGHFGFAFSRSVMVMICSLPVWSLVFDIDVVSGSGAPPRDTPDGRPRRVPRQLRSRCPAPRARPPSSASPCRRLRGRRASVPRARQSTALHGFAHCHGFGDLVQFPRPNIVDIPVDWNGLGDQRVVADAPDVGDEAGGIIFHGEPINKLALR
jgi:hypothetical protein